MKRIFIKDNKDLNNSKGVMIVVIDVLRAFSTACYVMSNNPKDYIVIGDLEMAYDLKKKNPKFILIGERNGIKQPGFDFGNSPTEIKDVDFSGKTIVHTTTLGTRGIINAFKHTDKVITGSFVNARAIIEYINKNYLNEIHLFSTYGTSDENEDFLCAGYIKDSLENKSVNFNKIKENIAKNDSGIFYLNNSAIEHARSDFSLCLELDKFKFVLEAKLEDSNLIHLRKVED